MMTFRSICVTVLLFVAGSTIFGQTKFTLSGSIRDAGSGELLIGANVYNGDDPIQGVSTNAYGFFSLSLPGGRYPFVISYLGYETLMDTILLNQNIQRDYELSEGVLIEAVTISAEEEDKRKNVQGTQMGFVELPVENVKKLPALLGEVDILKALQLLPGIMSSGEGTSGFYVRGGGADQNLVLLDEAVVYNTGHLLGFFSVFNADAIKNTTLIKGGIPANYGGRISSVVDVQMKEGNNRRYQVDGGIGLISSRLTIQGPIRKEESSFIVSGRRTYLVDLIQPLLDDGDFAGSNYYFYDLNAKFNTRLTKRDKIFLSGYFGRDVLKFRQENRDFRFDLPYGNQTATLRWNHLFSDKMFMNLSAIYNDYKFNFDGEQEDFVIGVFSGVRDWNFKLDFDYFPDPRHNFKFGINYTYHKMSPNIANATNGETEFETSFDPKYSQELAAYVLDDFRINEKWAVNTGLRLTYFSQLGPYTSKIDGRSFGKFEVVKPYYGIEPRLNVKYAVNPNLSIKSSVMWANQFVHLVSNSSSTLPTDIWVPSTEIVQPQKGLQIATGVFKNFKEGQVETSVEVFYKDLDNQLDYRDDFVQDFSSEEEDAFVAGIGRAYGAEFFVRKSSGNLTGWIGYTLSKSERSFDAIENGRWYSTSYDRRHDLSVVANYTLSPKVELGANFIYGSGRYFTPYSSFYFIEGNISPEYGPRNSAQLEAYHRLDISLTYTPKALSSKNYKSSWTFSVYNIYNRKNPFFIYYDDTVDRNAGTAQLEAFKVTIFPIIPSITYNFSWKQK